MLRDRPGEADVVDDSVGDPRKASCALQGVPAHERAPSGSCRPPGHAPHRVEQVEEVDEGRDQQPLRRGPATQPGHAAVQGKTAGLALSDEPEDSPSARGWVARLAAAAERLGV